MIDNGEGTRVHLLKNTCSLCSQEHLADSQTNELLHCSLQHTVSLSHGFHHKSPSVTVTNVYEV